MKNINEKKESVKLLKAGKKLELEDKKRKQFFQKFGISTEKIKSDIKNIVNPDIVKEGKVDKSKMKSILESIFKIYIPFFISKLKTAVNAIQKLANSKDSNVIKKFIQALVYLGMTLVINTALICIIHCAIRSLYYDIFETRLTTTESEKRYKKFLNIVSAVLCAATCGAGVEEYFKRLSLQTGVYKEYMLVFNIFEFSLYVRMIYKLKDVLTYRINSEIIKADPTSTVRYTPATLVTIAVRSRLLMVGLHYFMGFLHKLGYDEETGEVSKKSFMLPYIIHVAWNLNMAMKEITTDAPIKIFSAFP